MSEIPFDAQNAGYAQALYEEFARNPEAVPPAWREFFSRGPEATREAGLLVPESLQGDGYRTAPAPTPAGPAATVPEVESMETVGVDELHRLLPVVDRATALLQAFREHGHQLARIDPLGSEPPGHPQLDPSFFGTTMEELEQLSASVVLQNGDDESLAAALRRLRDLYGGTTGYEFEHLEDPKRVEWLWEAVEEGRYSGELDEGERVRLLQRLTEVEGLEHFLHRAYLGQKRFSVEGNDMLIPMLDLALERAAEGGALEVVIGMAHRGRLNVLAHTVGIDYAEILREFEGVKAKGALVVEGTGDVKYHHGAVGEHSLPDGNSIDVTLMPNPSHLEFVNPVAEGFTRGRQVLAGDDGTPKHSCVLPVLIHGDAAFSAEGVVAETLNLARLEAYTTGGTIHVIVNNQIGFTTTPSEGRSTRYASDLAKGYDFPIVHVNADDPEACLAAVRLAMAYRATFSDDFVIDLVGYRRHGHNEGDEPTYTQPELYEKIDDHSTVRELWARELVEAGVVTEKQVEKFQDAVAGSLRAAQDDVQEEGGEEDGAGGEAEAGGDSDASAGTGEVGVTEEEGSGEASGERSDGDEGEAETDEDAADGEGGEGGDEVVSTAVSFDDLREVNEAALSYPEGFNVHPKLQRQLDERREEFGEDATVDWAHAETLAFGSLLGEGVPVRLTGQDSERGTFSQRHMVLHDVETGETHTPLAHYGEGRLEIHNSPLSEMAVVGFEYGYSVSTGRDLVLWEAQFGDFVNAAQVAVDQFVSSGREKWNQLSDLVMLLPHGYEGQGPEHSSARLERFLILCAEENMWVEYPTTPAQYFHLLRRQAHLRPERPLVVMTPKSLLRHPRAVSPVSELADGGFRRVIADPEVDDPAGIRRLILCAGKIYYDLLTSDLREEAGETAVGRVEELYPFPRADLKELIEGYPDLEEVLWVQEEPRNMGALSYIGPRLRAVVPRRIPLRPVARPERASPAEGKIGDHKREQERIVREALTAGERSRDDAEAATTD